MVSSQKPELCEGRTAQLHTHVKTMEKWSSGVREQTQDMGLQTVKQDVLTQG